FFFFFQAEDGIRDFHVTGVQTCALAIYHAELALRAKPAANPHAVLHPRENRLFLKAPCLKHVERVTHETVRSPEPQHAMLSGRQIGRASCRERVSEPGGEESSRREKRRA